MKRVAIYIRVSTSKQDTDNQRRELEAVAKRSGWQVVKVFEDAGISGAKGRDQRPGLAAVERRHHRWSVLAVPGLHSPDRSYAGVARERNAATLYVQS